MKRWVAVLLLAMMATFLAASSNDHCHELEKGSTPIQHLLCLDDCAPALLPKVPTPPPPDATPELVYKETLTDPVLDLNFEPEETPPRA